MATFKTGDAVTVWSCWGGIESLTTVSVTSRVGFVLENGMSFTPDGSREFDYADSDIYRGRECRITKPGDIERYRRQRAYGVVRQAGREQWDRLDTDQLVAIATLLVPHGAMLGGV